MKYIANCSFGKDSTAMVLKLIEQNKPLDIVVFFDTGVEFSGAYKTRDIILPILKEHNIEYVELRYKKPFMYYMLEHEYKTLKGEHKKGYGWCGGPCRWATKHKTSTIDKWLKTIGDYKQYIGIAYDEQKRLERKNNQDINKLYPLIEFKMTEKDCLEYCYSKGIDFDGIYKYLSRMSCWCCRNKNLKELQQYHDHLPEYFNKLVELEKKIGQPMKKPKYLMERNWNENKNS